MKKWYLSKVIWVNALALIGGFFAQDILSPERQVQILGVINLVLRLVTKEEVSW